MEEDEAGRLRAFRQRFGRGWDAETVVEGGEESDEYVSPLLLSYLIDLLLACDIGTNWCFGIGLRKIV